MKQEKEDYQFDEEWHEPSFKNKSMVKKTILLALNCTARKLFALVVICGIEAIYQAFKNGSFVLGVVVAKWLIIELIISIWNEVEEKRKLNEK